MATTPSIKGTTQPTFKLGKGSTGYDTPTDPRHATPKGHLDLLLSTHIIQNGFWDTDDLSLSFVDLTRTLSLNLSAASFDVTTNKKHFSKEAGESLIIPNSEGLHYVFYDLNGDLSSTQTFSMALLTTHAFVATVYWDATNSKALRVVNELHGRMDASVHSYAHSTKGTCYDSGFDISGLTVGENGSDNAHLTMNIGDAVIWDEDIRFPIVNGSPQSLLGLSAPIFHLTGSGIPRKIAATPYPVTATGSGRAAWNEDVAGTWQLSEIPNNDYVLAHLFASTDVYEPMFWVMGQASYATRNAGRDGASKELYDIQHGNMQNLVKEFLPVATFLIQTGNTKTNAVKSSIEYVDGSSSEYINHLISNVGYSTGSSLTESEVDLKDAAVLIEAEAKDALNLQEAKDYADILGVSAAGKVKLAKLDTDNMSSRTGIILPFYEYPANIYTNAAYNDLIDLVKRYHNIPVYVILNPSNGAGVVTDGNYVAAIKRLQGAGAIVLGYIASNYTNLSISDAWLEVDKWETYYPGLVDGIFTDEQLNTDDPAPVAYYVELTAYIRKFYSYSMTNPGAGCPERYFQSDVSDCILTFENIESALTEAGLKGDYGGGYMDYSYTRRGTLVHTMADFDADKIKMIRKYTGLLYVTEQTLPNPWGAVSSHMELLFEVLGSNDDYIKHNVDASALPGVTNDSTEGFSKSSVWVYNGVYNVCLDSTKGNAVWKQLTEAESLEIAYASSGDQIVTATTGAGSRNLALDRDWQSFTAVADVALDYIDVLFGTLTDNTATIELREGEGLNGTLLATSSALTGDTGTLVVGRYTFPTAPATLNGQVYSIVHKSGTGNTWRYSSTSPYSGGRCNVSSSYDYLFTLNFSAGTKYAAITADATGIWREIDGVKKLLATADLFTNLSELNALVGDATLLSDTQVEQAIKVRPNTTRVPVTALWNFSTSSYLTDLIIITGENVVITTSNQVQGQRIKVKSEGTGGSFAGISIPLGSTYSFRYDTTNGWIVDGSYDELGLLFTSAYKTKVDSLVVGFLGWYATEAALRADHPTGTSVNSALIGETDSYWAWDADTADWKDTHSAQASSGHAIHDDTSVYPDQPKLKFIGNVGVSNDGIGGFSVIDVGGTVTAATAVTAFAGFAENAVKDVPSLPDSNTERVVEVLEFEAGDGKTNTQLDFDTLDEALFEQEDAANGTDFLNGSLLLHNAGSAGYTGTAEAMANEVTVTVLGGGLFSSGTAKEGLFDGVRDAAWSSTSHGYWRDNTWLEVEWSQEVRLWRSGSASYPGENGSLGIEKWNGTGWDAVVGKTLTPVAVNNTTWALFTDPLVAGRYRFTSAPGNMTLDSEWYAEGLAVDYPTAKGYYAYSKPEACIPLSYVTEITTATLAHTEPTNTSIKLLVTFDGGTTWKRWNGSAWVDAGIVGSDMSSYDFDTNGNTVAEIQTNLSGLTITNESYLGLAIYLKSTLASATPSIDGLTLNYNESGSYVRKTGDYKVKLFTDGTRITKLTPGTVNVKVQTLYSGGANYLSDEMLSKLNSLHAVISYVQSIYVRSTGDDITGDGSLSTPYLTLGKALAHLAEYSITGSVVIDVGSLTIASQVVIKHPDGAHITIEGLTPVGNRPADFGKYAYTTHTAVPTEVTAPTADNWVCTGILQAPNSSKATAIAGDKVENMDKAQAHYQTELVMNLDAAISVQGPFGGFKNILMTAAGNGYRPVVIAPDGNLKNATNLCVMDAGPLHFDVGSKGIIGSYSAGHCSKGMTGDTAHVTVNECNIFNCGGNGLEMYRCDFKGFYMRTNCNLGTGSIFGGGGLNLIKYCESNCNVYPGFGVGNGALFEGHTIDANGAQNWGNIEMYYGVTGYIHLAGKTCNGSASHGITCSSGIDIMIHTASVNSNTLDGVHMAGSRLQIKNLIASGNLNGVSLIKGSDFAEHESGVSINVSGNTDFDYKAKNSSRVSCADAASKVCNPLFGLVSSDNSYIGG